MNKAVFFDRDGVLNDDYDHYYVYRPEDIKINPGVYELLTYLMKKKYLLVVISNQGGISKGLFTREDVEKTNARILELLETKHIRIEEVYYCPHYRETEQCICRKPDSLMIEKALGRFNIDPSVSYFIGDRLTDMEAGKKAGLRTIKVEPNQNMSSLMNIIS